MAQYRDPVTGDELTHAEWVSWRVQGIIRRWTTLIVITLVTVIVMTLGHVWTEPPTSVWNYAASYMALLIEGTVGIAMFSQTRRDAVILRETRATAARVEKLTEHMEELVEHVCELLEQGRERGEELVRNTEITEAVLNKSDPNPQAP